RSSDVTDIFTAGEVARATVTFLPGDDSTIDINDVTARVKPAKEADTIDLDVQAADDPNTFFADIATADDSGSGWWQVRWEVNGDEVKIVKEDTTTRFYV